VPERRRRLRQRRAIRSSVLARTRTPIPRASPWSRCKKTAAAASRSRRWGFLGWRRGARGRWIDPARAARALEAKRQAPYGHPQAGGLVPFLLSPGYKFAIPR